MINTVREGIEKYKKAVKEYKKSRESMRNPSLDYRHIIRERLNAMEEVLGLTQADVIRINHDCHEETKTA